VNLADLLFPKSCITCNRQGQYLCKECLNKIGLAKPICPYCQKPSIDGFTHIKCQKVFGLDGVTSVWNYEGIIRKSILSLKYKYATQIGEELVNCLANRLLDYHLPFTFPTSNAVASAGWYFLPIPIYWHRQNIRGFNQSILIGNSLCQKMNWKFIPDLLIKNKQTISQVELSGEARRKNLKNVFCVNPNYVLSTIYSVLLFDDVFTTGSTLHEAAKVLKRAGVKKVWGLTMAR